jgi:hypothetical protein
MPPGDGLAPVYKGWINASRYTLLETTLAAAKRVMVAGG